MSGWHLAQVNVGTLVAPEGDPLVQGFFDQLDVVNANAEASPGFVWRLKGEGNNATDLNPTPEPLFILNMSVWESVEALSAFAYRNKVHAAALAERKSWFEPMSSPHFALWWVRAGTEPGIDTALSRLWMLERYGPSAEAFTFRVRFPSPAALVSA